MTIADLPALNATLNGTSGVLLAVGYVLIRRRRVAAHRLCMASAFVVSTAFLVSYVIYHASHGATPFPGEGWIRPVYFTMLTSHILLAIAVVPLAVLTLFRGLAERFESHRKIARITLPIWLYVSVTGVLVYWMLYHLYAA
jgi:uncharacterized membrane protein YozB (DUF420 family)